MARNLRGNTSDQNITGQTTDGSDIPEVAEQYDPAEFFVPTSGGDDDFSVTQAFRCTSKTARQLEVILHSKKFPYVTVGDLLRHALHRHVIWLLKLAPSLPSYLPAIESIREIIRHETEMAKFHNTLEEMKSTINKLLSYGRGERARATVQRVYYMVQKIEDAEWRSFYDKAIKDSYGFLLEARPLSISNFMEGGEQE